MHRNIHVRLGQDLINRYKAEISVLSGQLEAERMVYLFYQLINPSLFLLLIKAREDMQGAILLTLENNWKAFEGDLQVCVIWCCFYRNRQTVFQSSDT